MIDIHCHILPNLDDGAKHLTESIEMAHQAVSEGITSIIATPHHQNGKYNNTKEEILQYVEQLNGILQKEMIDLTILPGQETRIYGEILEDYERGEILTLNNSDKYLFIEFPSNHVPRYTQKLLYDIQLQGITPIIVHPERNSEIIENPGILYELVKKGACTQVTATSLVGGFGKNIKKFSFELIEANLTHFIASDAHGLKTRKFNMREAFALVEKQFGFNKQYMFMENAQYLVNGEGLMIEPPERIKKKKFLGLF
ncbi:tyrosine-protein phosphatase [Sutcliffiella halmapala]|uniref:tyrosine-protein phosphatase n=1 Tax=Sutcliffiella halmapala TaxID=79882 RepID=UPI000995A2F0|nr:CpsB/CapC family capsule biosynthesis tyrosine phosphatase [Sutcliffiella halmapala]